MTKLCPWTIGVLLVAAPVSLPPASGATLYGVIGDNSVNPVTPKLYILNQSNAAATLALTLGNGDYGEAIAYNPIDKLMYHWSGNFTTVMETINLATNAVTNIPQTGDAQGHIEVLGATWDATNRRFLLDTFDARFLAATTGGVTTDLGYISGLTYRVRGLAFVGGTLYSNDVQQPVIHTMNPATGAVLTNLTATAPGLAQPLSGFNGLATDPDTNILWAIGRTGGGTPGNIGARYLGTLDPITGVFTSVGALNDNFAGLAFVADPPTRTLDAPYQVRYASNLTLGDSMVNITNTGANGASLYGPGFGGPAGNICVNVYAFSPDEQLISCCSCPLTPNGLVNLTANRDLVSNTLTGIRPDSIVIKLVATSTGVKNTPAPDQEADSVGGTPTFTGSNCTNSAALAGTDQFQVVSGMLAWGTTLHSDWEPVHPDELYITETGFVSAKLSYDELKSIRGRCANIVGNGSTFGQCRSCRLGGLGGSKL